MFTGKSFARSCVAATSVFLATLGTASGQICGATSPPFTQAPAIGGNTSAHFLLLIDTDGSLRVKEDTTQGPYDGEDDTLFGVQNNSSSSVAAIPLRSPLSPNGNPPIFGFDGDGISTFPPILGPFGPTGYEGPGVSFTSISADQNSGVVNFNPPIPPGGCAYFALEAAIVTQCTPITNPPARLLQGDAAWSGNNLGPSTTTIGAYGCYLTSTAMMLNYYAAKQGKAFRTDPAQLNTFLTSQNAIDNTGAVIGGGPAIVAGYARSNGVTLYYNGMLGHRDDFTLDQYLCNGQTPLMYVGNPHWVLGIGQATNNGVETYSTLDPDSYPNGDTLSGGFNNKYGALELYSDTTAPLPGLYITAHSPVEMVLYGRDGTATGFNPTNNTSYGSIPSSGYAVLELGNDQDHSQPNTEPIKILTVNGPATNIYDLQVIGTGKGAYKIDVVLFDGNNTKLIQVVNGTATPGSVQTFKLAAVSPRDLKNQVLFDLALLSPTNASKTDTKQLALAIKKLSATLVPSLWVDANHIDRKKGRTVFSGEAATANILAFLIKNKKSTVNKTALQNDIDSLVAADRLLASISISEAAADGVKEKSIALEQKVLSRGDKAAQTHKGSQAISAYGTAWNHPVKK